MRTRTYEHEKKLSVDRLMIDNTGERFTEQEAIAIANGCGIVPTDTQQWCPELDKELGGFYRLSIGRLEEGGDKGYR